MDPLLVESGLFGRGLVPLSRPEDIRRYNEALVDLGIEPTKLDRIDIDGAGWSPQVAVEKGKQRYLDHGEADQAVIIATPDQERKPIHVPPNSILRPLLRNFFARSRREIADITTSACVRVSVDQDVVETAKDLLHYESVVAKASAGSLSDAAREQRTLAGEFLSDDGNAWFDSDLRRRLMESGANGNLLRRKVEIPDFPFTLIGNFWHRAFGGVFVLQAGKDKILIVEDQSLLADLRPAKGERYVAFAMSQRREIIAHLIDEGLVELDLSYFKQNPAELSELKNYIMADLVCRACPDEDYASMSASKRKSVLLDERSKLPEILPQFDRFCRDLSGRAVARSNQHSELLGQILLRPSKAAGENAHPILWMLLLRLQENPFDVFRLYAYDKERFFQLFEQWPLAKKRWAAKYISAKYKPEMNQ